MSDREYIWGTEGEANAARNGVLASEVIDALYAPDALRVDRQLGADLLLVAGMAATGRVIAVMCERVAGTTRHQILNAAPVAGVDLDQWRSNLP